MSTNTPTGERTFMGQPRGLATLFLTEMWERFSYYGMRAILVLYLIAPPDGAAPPGAGLGLTVAVAAAIYGSYSSLIYLLPLAGGWVADRLTGPRRAVLMGGIVIAAGHFMMAVPVQLLFWVGLVVVAAGTGLLKPSISAIVGDLYTPHDTRRDSGFSLFYMGINLGAFIAPLIVGWLAESVSWHIAFLAAGIGMLIGICQYVIGGKGLGEAGKAVPKPATRREKVNAGRLLGIVIIGVAAVLIIDVLLFGFSVDFITIALSITVISVAIAYFYRLFRNPDLTPVDRERVKAFAYLFLAAVVFWAIYDQSGSTLTEFAQEYTNTTFGSFQMPVAWLQSINPIFIIIFAPIFAGIWSYLGNRAPSTPAKFGIAIFGVGLSFLIMIPPAMAAETAQESAVWWLVGVYLVQTWSELLLSPNGLSATTKLAPAGLLSQMLALWFLATAVGDSIGGQVVRLVEIVGYSWYFAILGLGTILIGVLFTFFIKKIRALMEGVDN
ncbi:MAG: peptide MFS transporter [Actinomycetes bacterium]